MKRYLLSGKNTRSFSRLRMYEASESYEDVMTVVRKEVDAACKKNGVYADWKTERKGDRGTWYNVSVIVDGNLTPSVQRKLDDALVDNIWRSNKSVLKDHDVTAKLEMVYSGTTTKDPTPVITIEFEK